MRFIRPKIIGTLKIKKMMAGNWAVTNGIKNPPNKILIPCKTKEEGNDIIKKIINAKTGEELFFSEL